MESVSDVGTPFIEMEGIEVRERRDLCIVLLEWRPYKALYELALGLQYVGSSLRSAGYEVHIRVFEDSTIEKATQAVIGLKPDVVGFQLFRESAVPTFELAASIKTAVPHVTTVMGGHTATLHAAQILTESPDIDIIVCGEGELTMLDVCERLERGEDLDDCQGICYRKDGKVRRTPPRPIINDLNAIPKPIPDVILDQTNPKNPCVIATIQTSRGCMASCAFCVENRVYEGGGKLRRRVRWRGRTPRSIVDEIDDLVHLFPGKRLVIRFTDSSFEDPEPQTKSRIIEILDLLDERNIELAFSCFTRAESWDEVDRPLLTRMRQKGLFRVNIGFETGSRVSLKNVYTKRANVEDNLRSAELFRSVGIPVFGYSIMFNPFTSTEELKISADFLQRVRMAYHPEMWFHDIIIHSDTRLFSHTASEGLILGPSEDGYVFAYAFEDDRTADIHAVMKQVGALPSAMDVGEAMIKIEMEQQLYGVWEKRYEEMQRVAPAMQRYEAGISNIYQEIGQKQYELFLEIVDLGENGRLPQHGPQLVQAWDDLLIDTHGQLNRVWLQARMALARQNVYLYA